MGTQHLGWRAYEGSGPGMGHLSEDIKPSERMARLGSSGASGPPPASPECSSNSHKAPLETHALARAGIRGGFQKTQNIGIANSVSFFQRTSFPPSTNGHYVKAVQNRSPEEAPSGSHPREPGDKPPLPQFNLLISYFLNISFLAANP